MTTLKTNNIYSFIEKNTLKAKLDSKLTLLNTLQLLQVNKHRIKIRLSEKQFVKCQHLPNLVGTNRTNKYS